MSRKINWSAALIFISSPVFAVSPYFPETPTVDSPADGAIDVELNPELSGSPLAEKDSNGASASGNLVFDSAEWRFTSPNERFVITGGTRGDETTNLDSIPESTYIYDIPNGFNFNGVYTTRLEVTNTGVVQLFSADDSVAATVEMIPGALSDLRPSDDKAPILIVAPEAANDLTVAIAVQWTYLSDAIAGDIVLQAAFTSENGVGLFAIPSDLSEPLFNSTDSTISIDWTGPAYVAGDSLAGWKTTLTGGDSPASNFGLIFEPDNEGNISPSGSGQNGALDLYEWPEYISATGSDVTLPNPGLTLEPATEYAVQVRYTALEGASERKSDWSEPNYFTTGLDTSYSFPAPATADIQASVAKTFEFEISNNGSDDGQALVEIRLPFNAFEVLEGRFSEHYNATSDAAIKSCDDTTDFDADNTYLHCEITLEAGATATVAFLATFYDEGANTFEYRVCETLLDRCDDASYETASFSVAAAPETPAPEEEPEETDEDSGSSSGGGSMFWLTILGVTLFRRQKPTSRIL